MLSRSRRALGSPVSSLQTLGGGLFVCSPGDRSGSFGFGSVGRMPARERQEHSGALFDGALNKRVVEICQFGLRQQPVQ